MLHRHRQLKRRQLQQLPSKLLTGMTPVERTWKIVMISMDSSIYDTGKLSIMTWLSNNHLYHREVQMLSYLLAIDPVFPNRLVFLKNRAGSGAYLELEPYYQELKTKFPSVMYIDTSGRGTHGALEFSAHDFLMLKMFYS